MDFGIGPTLLLLLAASGVGSITVVDHDDVEVSNLHWQVIQTKRGIIMINGRSTCDAMRSLNPTVLVTDVTETLIWDNGMEIVRGNEYVVDISNNSRLRYLINDACILVERDPKMAAMANGGSGR